MVPFTAHGIVKKWEIYWRLKDNFVKLVYRTILYLESWFHRLTIFSQNLVTCMWCQYSVKCGKKRNFLSPKKYISWNQLKLINRPSGEEFGFYSWWYPKISWNRRFLHHPGKNFILPRVVYSKLEIPPGEEWFYLVNSSPGGLKLCKKSAISRNFLYHWV